MSQRGYGFDTLNRLRASGHINEAQYVAARRLREVVGQINSQPRLPMNSQHPGACAPPELKRWLATAEQRIIAAAGAEALTALRLVIIDGHHVHSAKMAYQRTSKTRAQLAAALSAIIRLPQPQDLVPKTAQTTTT